MANYQTLTEINDLLEKIEILKTEKENLRTFLKNLKLQSSQNLYQYKIEKQKQNRIKVKSVFLKQNLLSFKQKESELIDKMKTKYSQEIDKNFEFLIKNICKKIAQKSEKNLNNEVICSEYWQEIVENCGFNKIQIVKEKFKENSKNNSKHIFSEKVVNSDLVLRIILVTKIYFLDKNYFISSLSEYLIAKNLGKIAKIKIEKDIGSKTNLSDNFDQDNENNQNSDEIYEEIQSLDENNKKNLDKQKTQELNLEEINLLETKLDDF